MGRQQDLWDKLRRELAANRLFWASCQQVLVINMGG